MKFRQAYDLKKIDSFYFLVRSNIVARSLLFFSFNRGQVLGLKSKYPP